MARLHWKFVLIAVPMMMIAFGVTYGYVALGFCGFCDYSPPRPAGVPQNAVWAGGPDGGSYILCRVDSDRDVDRCVVWNDFTGDVVEHGDYRLLREKRAATVDELCFTWADRGGWIGLEHDRVLDNLNLKRPR